MEMRYIKSFKIFEGNSEEVSVMKLIKSDCHPFIDLMKNELGSEIKEWLIRAKFIVKKKNLGLTWNDNNKSWNIPDDLDPEELDEYKKIMDYDGSDGWMSDIKNLDLSDFFRSPFLFRGIGEGGGSVDTDDTFTLKDYSKRDKRFTLDSSSFLVKHFNEHFEDKFGVRIRSKGTFCGSSIMANSYGDLYLIFPIGKFDYYWSKDVPDLFSWSEYKNWYDDCHSFDATVNEDDSMLQKADGDIKDIVSTYKKNANLKEALWNGERFFQGNEVMIDCDKFYLLNLHDWKFEEYVWLLENLFT